MFKINIGGRKILINILRHQGGVNLFLQAKVCIVVVIISLLLRKSIRILRIKQLTLRLA